MGRVVFVGIAFVLVLVIGGNAQEPAQKGNDDTPGPYELVVGWPHNYCGDGYVIGATAGIWAESPDRVMIFSRGCASALENRGDVNPGLNSSGNGAPQTDASPAPRWDHILNIVDRSGKLIESWEQHNKLFVRPHRIIVSPYDPERHVWLVDDGAHAIFIFTRDGKRLVQTIGTPGVQGNDETHFARPTDVGFLPDGTFFVTDGYVNTRVVKFDRTGKFLMTWGRKGNPPNETRPGYMNTVHAIAIDQQRRLYISDRANHRVQIFDENGKFLDSWPDVPLPASFMLTADQYLWAVSGRPQKFAKYDLKGTLLTAWAAVSAVPGGFWGIHQFHVDSEGNLYTADVTARRPRKFRPSPGADRAGLIGSPAIF